MYENLARRLKGVPRQKRVFIPFFVAEMHMVWEAQGQ